MTAFQTLIFMNSLQEPLVILIPVAWIKSGIYCAVAFLFDEWGGPTFFPQWWKASERTVGKYWVVHGAAFIVACPFAEIWQWDAILVTAFTLGIFYFALLQICLKRRYFQTLKEVEEINEELVDKLQNLAIVSKEKPEVLPHPQGGTAHLHLRNGVVLETETITHIAMEDHYARIHWKDEKGRKELLEQVTLKELMELLPPSRFVQIHRSYVVNLSHILYIKRQKRAYRLLMDCENILLPISRQRSDEVLPKLHTFLKAKSQ